MKKFNEYQVFNDNTKYAPIADYRKRHKIKKQINWILIATWTTIGAVLCCLIKTLYNLIN